MKPKYTTVFVIREVSTGKLIKFGSKSGWATSGAAKSAFALHMTPSWRGGAGLFDKQCDYVLEEIK